MFKNPHKDVPEELQIETMLSKFKPRPTIRFYSKISTAPWQKTASAEKLISSNSRKPARRFIWGMLVLFLMLAFISIVFIPSVRVIARQIIYSFILAPSNQLEVQVTLTNPGDLFHFSDPDNFPLSINEVQQQAGFVVKKIEVPPENLLLVGSRYDQNYAAVTILYQANDYKLFLTQRLVGKGADVFSVGASAQINMVKIGNHQGEYVVGGWKAVSTQSTSKTSTPGAQASISAVWDSTLSQSTLRWQADGFIYELRTIGEGSPSQSELILLANELK